MINTKPKYITKDDYFQWSGINLDYEFSNGNTDNPTNATNIFISRIEKWLVIYLKNNFRMTEDCEDWNEEALKEAILYQIEYNKMHGDVSLMNDKDSQGRPIQKLAPNAYMVLQNNFMTVQGRRAGGRSGYQQKYK